MGGLGLKSEVCGEEGVGGERDSKIPGVSPSSLCMQYCYLSQLVNLLTCIERFCFHSDWLNKTLENPGVSIQNRNRWLLSMRNFNFWSEFYRLEKRLQPLDPFVYRC